MVARPSKSANHAPNRARGNRSGPLDASPHNSEKRGAEITERSRGEILRFGEPRKSTARALATGWTKRPAGCRFQSPNLEREAARQLDLPRAGAFSRLQRRDLAEVLWHGCVQGAGTGRSVVRMVED